MYPEPEEFRPERFLKDGKPNPDIRDSVAAFGYGRRQVKYFCVAKYIIMSTETNINRICPGQFMATRSLFAIVSSVLSAFDISPPLDASGNPVKLRPEMSPGIIS
jgi:cytochrome P450